jgi:hypothetical protein
MRCAEFDGCCLALWLIFVGLSRKLNQSTELHFVGVSEPESRCVARVFKMCVQRYMSQKDLS